MATATVDNALDTRPAADEAAPYYFRYIDQVPSGDVVRTLERQSVETIAFLERIPAGQSLHRYAADKWSIRAVVSHMSDCERLFVFRAFWFARGFETSLPSFDQDVAVRTAGANDREWDELVEEFGAVRAATLSFFRSLPADAWSRRGIASDLPFSVRALAWMTAGHVAHHVTILRERYFAPLQ